MSLLSVNCALFISYERFVNYGPFAVSYLHSYLGSQQYRVILNYCWAFIVYNFQTGNKTA
jgi:hypothetical protein